MRVQLTISNGLDHDGDGIVRFRVTAENVEFRGHDPLAGFPKTSSDRVDFASGLCILLVAAILLGGCSTASVCDYSWRDNGWTPISAEPQGLARELQGEMAWFTNSAGDYLACPKRSWFAHRANCGNVYEVHRKQQSSGYEVKAIVCMT
jgi:hypothetical protein